MGVASYSATPVGRYIGAHIFGADRRNLNPTLGTAMQVPYSSIVIVSWWLVGFSQNSRIYAILISHCRYFISNLILHPTLFIFSSCVTVVDAQ
jgi:hypothetical protein